MQHGTCCAELLPCRHACVSMIARSVSVSRCAGWDPIPGAGLQQAWLQLLYTQEVNASGRLLERLVIGGVHDHKRGAGPLLSLQQSESLARSPDSSQRMPHCMDNAAQPIDKQALISRRCRRNEGLKLWL